MGSAWNCLAEQWLTRQSISRVEASWPEGGAGHGPHLRPWIDPRETGMSSPRPTFQDCAFPPPSADTCLSQRWPTSRAQPTHGAIGPCVPISAPSAPPASTRSIPVDDPGGRPLMDPGAPGAPPLTRLLAPAMARSVSWVERRGGGGPGWLLCRVSRFVVLVPFPRHPGPSH
jgi:hypothetical protein